MSGLLAGALPQSPSLSDKLCPSLEHRTICLGWWGLLGKELLLREALFGDGGGAMGSQGWLGLFGESFGGGMGEEKVLLGLVELFGVEMGVG